MKHLRLVVAALAVLLPVLTTGAGEQNADRWYELWMGDARAGWAHEVVTTEGDTITTKSDMELSMGRAAQAVTIRQSSVFTETLAGVPVWVTVSQQLGQAPIESRYVFRDGGVLLVSETDGVRHETPLPRPEGDWLPPAAAARFLAQRLASGATEIAYRTLEPSNGMQPVEVRRTGVEPGEVEVLGKKTQCFHARSTTAVGPTMVRAEEWIAPDGAMLRTETAMGALRLTMVAATRERAMREAEPAEVMLSTFVRPDRPISAARRRTRGVYKVSLTEDRLPELPGSAYQRVEPLGERAARVTVDMQHPTAAGEVDKAAYLGSTTYADWDSPLIRDLTAGAIDRAEGPRAQAEALRRFVYGHIKDKNLGTAFAAASQTAESREGDCSEHGVLLAAMLRAAGIPSRVAVGVVYVDQFAGERSVFGYHMWSQALLETDAGPAWVDLDATLDEDSAFDATHIAFGVSSLGEEDAISSLAGIAPMLGAVRIKVDEVE